MCQCTPEVRTPFCGKPGCKWPPQEIAPAMGPQAELHIIWNADGSVTVHGPLQNKMVCYGMLERAKDVVRAYEQAKSGLVVPFPKTQGMKQ